MKNARLHKYALLVAFCTLMLVLAGASVTSTESSLSVPDWPLSYGQILPEMTGGVLFETGHRLVAKMVGFLVIILAIWIQRVDQRAWVRKLGWTALGVVCLQGLLGGLTVLFLLPKPVSISHACLAQLFFSLVVTIALVTSPGWRQGVALVEDAGTPSFRTLAMVTPVAVLIQIALGAGFRHHVLNILPHIAGALIVTSLVMYTAIAVMAQFPNHKALKQAATALLGITSMQVVLGVAAYASRLASAGTLTPPTSTIWYTVLHVGVGGLTMAASVVLAIQIRRNVVVAVEVPEQKLAMAS